MKLPEPKKTASGDYRIQLRLDGKSVYIHGRTAKECRDKARLYKSEYVAGVREIRINPKTLTQAIDEYISKRENTLSPASIAGYRCIQRNRFPELMENLLDEKVDWQAAVNLEATRCAPKTLRSAFRLLASVYAENGITVPKVSLPPLERNEKKWLEPEQIQKLIKSVYGTEYALPVLLGLHGLRRSELLAIKWNDIDLGKGLIHVHGAVVINSENKYIEKPTTKTETSTRAVPIMIPELRQTLEAIPDKSGTVVKQSPNYVGHAVNRACKKAGVQEVGTHGLRHSFASLCYHLGLSELETMRLGGWSDASTMRKIYTHLSETDRNKAVDKLSAFFKNAYENA